MVWYNRFPSEKLVGLVLGAMSCFFGCFRIKASNPDLAAPKQEEIAVTRSENTLSSLFLVDGDSNQIEKQSQKQLRGHGEADVREELKDDEANFRRTHGIEIPEVSEKLDDTSPRHGEGKSVKREEPVTESGSVVIDSPSSCMTDGDCIRRANAKENIKPVEVQDDEENHSEARSYSPSSKNVHFDLESSSCGSSALTGLGSQKKGHELQSCTDVEGTFPSLQNSDKEIRDLSAKKQTENEDSSLTSWFKPKLVEEKEVHGIENVRHHRKIPSDRPILGMVAAHWNEEDEEEEEKYHVSPKSWDGNGIPNSTTKYNEDQKVSWHATSFEERLEKALSEESFISQRKPMRGTPLVEFDEAEESDTALSSLKPSSAAANLKSVVSF